MIDIDAALTEAESALKAADKAESHEMSDMLMLRSAVYSLIALATMMRKQV